MAPPWCASFLSGEYVSIWNQAGDLHAFQVRLGPICFGVRECRRSTIARRPDAIREMIKSKFLSMCLPEMELGSYMVPMRTPGRGLLRAAMAVVFGFMSLVHGPVMTFAKASSAPAHHASHHGAHHHHAAPAEDPSPAKPRFRSGLLCLRLLHRD